VVLIAAELELSLGKLVFVLESVHVHLFVPAQHFHQLSEVLRDHRQQEGVELLVLLEVVHQEVDELAHLYLLLVTACQASDLLLYVCHASYSWKHLEVDLPNS